MADAGWYAVMRFLVERSGNFQIEYTDTVNDVSSAFRVMPPFGEFLFNACNNYERVCAERDDLAEALNRFCDVYESDSPLRPAAMVNECRKAREALAKVQP